MLDTGNEEDIEETLCFPEELRHTKLRRQNPRKVINPVEVEVKDTYEYRVDRYPYRHASPAQETSESLLTGLRPEVFQDLQTFPPLLCFPRYYNRLSRTFLLYLPTKLLTSRISSFLSLHISHTTITLNHQRSAPAKMQFDRELSAWADESVNFIRSHGHVLDAKQLVAELKQQFEGILVSPSQVKHIISIYGTQEPQSVTWYPFEVIPLISNLIPVLPSSSIRPGLLIPAPTRPDR